MVISKRVLKNTWIEKSYLNKFYACTDFIFLVHCIWWDVLGDVSKSQTALTLSAHAIMIQELIYSKLHSKSCDYLYLT